MQHHLRTDFAVPSAPRCKAATGVELRLTSHGLSYVVNHWAYPQASRNQDAPYTDIFLWQTSDQT